MALQELDLPSSRRNGMLTDIRLRGVAGSERRPSVVPEAVNRSNWLSALSQGE